MYRKALAINPSHPQSWTNLGIAHALFAHLGANARESKL